jgi:Domain of unknown function (DUF5122) beta-propeller
LGSIRGRLLRPSALIALACAWLLGFAFTPARAQNADDGFDPDANNTIRALAVQADGLLVVGGDFTNIAGQSRTRLARLFADGSLDLDFATTTRNPFGPWSRSQPWSVGIAAEQSELRSYADRSTILLFGTRDSVLFRS